ncbi:hypothetical protein SH139x_002943 [Planctomycetaceae bacterium SH139]
MSLEPTEIMIAGVGSPQGDDQAGWMVIDALRRAEQPVLNKPYSPRKRPLSLHHVVVPHDLLDFITQSSTLHVIDAVKYVGVPADAGDSFGVQRYRVQFAEDSGQLTLQRQLELAEVATAELSAASLASATSHQFGLLDSLALAGQLGMLPSEVNLWTIPIITYSLPAVRPRVDLTDLAVSSVSASTADWVEVCAKQLLREVQGA